MLLNVKDVDEVLAIMEDNFSSFNIKLETIDILKALGRITAEDVDRKSVV